MLTIKTYLDKSQVNGIGLYAKSFIPKGKIIWEYFPLIDITYTAKEWRELELNLHPASFDKINRYTYKENDLYITCTDDSQFMNHSEKKFNVANTEDLKSMFAIRDIQEGEELLCNYFDYSDSDDFHVKKLRKLESKT